MAGAREVAGFRVARVAHTLPMRGPWQSLLFVAAGSAYCGLGVLLGAAGAHVFGPTMTVREFDAYRTAVDFQMIHALGLIATGLLAARLHNRRAALWTGYFFLGGVPLFCFSIYGSSVYKLTILDSVAPFGGLCFLAGWILLALAAHAGWSEAGTSGNGTE